MTLVDSRLSSVANVVSSRPARDPVTCHKEVDNAGGEMAPTTSPNTHEENIRNSHYFLKCVYVCVCVFMEVKSQIPGTIIIGCCEPTDGGDRNRIPNC